MDKDNTIQLEDAMSPYTTPFMVNKDLERRSAVHSYQGLSTREAKDEIESCGKWTHD